MCIVSKMLVMVSIPLIIIGSCVHPDLQLKSYHLPCKLFKKWKDLLSQYTNASYDDICQGVSSGPPCVCVCCVLSPPFTRVRLPTPFIHVHTAQECSEASVLKVSQSITAYSRVRKQVYTNHVCVCVWMYIYSRITCMVICGVFKCS